MKAPLYLSPPFAPLFSFSTRRLTLQFLYCSHTHEEWTARATRDATTGGERRITHKINCHLSFHSAPSLLSSLLFPRFSTVYDQSDRQAFDFPSRDSPAVLRLLSSLSSLSSATMLPLRSQQQQQQQRGTREAVLSPLFPRSFLQNLPLQSNTHSAIALQQQQQRWTQQAAAADAPLQLHST